MPLYKGDHVLVSDGAPAMKGRLGVVKGLAPKGDSAPDEQWYYVYFGRLQETWRFPERELKHQ